MLRAVLWSVQPSFVKVFGRYTACFHFPAIQHCPVCLTCSLEMEVFSNNGKTHLEPSLEWATICETEDCS